MARKKAQQRKPPSYLSASARKLWLELYQTYVMDLPASLVLLTQLCESWDRARACREALRGKPLVTSSKRGGPRVHPLLVEERAAREQTLRFARALRIHVEEIES